MNDVWKTIRLGMYVFALPLVATAAASAHQWMTDSIPVTIPDVPVATTISDGSTIVTLRNHTITLDREGVIRGRLVSIESKTLEAVGLGGLKVYFARGGEIAKQVTTTSDGTFEVAGLAEGAYSFIAAGESGFAAYGVNVESGDSKPTVMEVAAVSPKFSAVKEILEKRVPAIVAQEIADLATANVESSAPITIEGSNRVQISDGTLVGSVVPIWGQHQSVAGTFVHIVKNDKQVTAVRVDEKGNFQIPDLEPGVYDFVAAGPSGFAAVSFEAVGDEEFVDDSEIVDTSIPVTAVAAAYAPSPTLNIALTSPQDGYIVGDSVGYACDSCNGYVDNYAGPPIEYAGEAVGNGCAAGAACGGCGDFSGYSNCCGSAGGGRLGRFGRIALIAGIAVGIIAIANGDGPDQSPIQP